MSFSWTFGRTHTKVHTPQSSSISVPAAATVKLIASFLPSCHYKRITRLIACLLALACTHTQLMTCPLSCSCPTSSVSSHTHTVLSSHKSHALKIPHSHLHLQATISLRAVEFYTERQLLMSDICQAKKKTHSALAKVAQRTKLWWLDKSWKANFLSLSVALFAKEKEREKALA